MWLIMRGALRRRSSKNCTGTTTSPASNTAVGHIVLAVEP